MNVETKQHKHPRAYQDCISDMLEMHAFLTAALRMSVLGRAHSRGVNAENNTENSPEAKVPE